MVTLIRACSLAKLESYSFVVYTTAFTIKVSQNRSDLLHKQYSPNDNERKTWKHFSSLLFQTEHDLQSITKSKLIAANIAEWSYVQK